MSWRLTCPGGCHVQEAGLVRVCDWEADLFRILTCPASCLVGGLVRRLVRKVPFFRKLTFAGLGGCLVLEGDLSGAWEADPGGPLWLHFGSISANLGASEASGVCETTRLGVRLVWEADVSL